MERRASRRGWISREPTEEPTHGCREIGGSKHAKWRGPQDQVSAIPRHKEIGPWSLTSDLPTARRACATEPALAQNAVCPGGVESSLPRTIRS